MLDDHEGTQENKPQSDQPERPPAPPPPALRFHQAVDDGQESEGERSDPCDVELLANGLLGLVQDEQPDHEGDGPDRPIDEEDALPRDVLDEEATDDRSARGRRGRGADPDAHGPIELLGWEGRLQQGQGIREQEGAECPLHAPKEDDATDGADQADGQ